MVTVTPTEDQPSLTVADALTLTEAIRSAREKRLPLVAVIASTDEMVAKSQRFRKCKWCDVAHTSGPERGIRPALFPPNAHLSSRVAMSESIRELDHRHLWHPFTQQRDWCEEDPVVIERGEGTDLIDVDGVRLPGDWSPVDAVRMRPSSDASSA